MFLACNADNLTDFDLRTLIESHRSSDVIATISVFYSEHPMAGGIVELDGSGIVVDFIEKPSNPSTNLTNAGMYVFHPAVLDEMTDSTPNDIGYNVLPLLVGRARAVLVDGYFRDIGTLADYRLAQDDWPHGEVP